MRMFGKYLLALLHHGIAFWETGQDWLARVMLLLCVAAPLGWWGVVQVLDAPDMPGLVPALALIVFLLLAPFLAWRAEYNKVTVFEEDRKPKFEVHLKMQTSPKGIPDNLPAERRWLELRVENTSDAVLQGVSAKLFSMTNVGEIPSHYEGRCFAIKGYEKDAKFDTEISPRDRAFFNVAYSNELPPPDGRRYGLSFAKGETLEMPASNYPHTLKIAVTAENAVGEQRTVVMSVQANHVMKIEELADQKVAIAAPKMSWFKRLLYRN